MLTRPAQKRPADPLHAEAPRAPRFEMLPYDVLEAIVSFVINDCDKQSLRKVCRRTRLAPCLQPSGIVIDLAQPWLNLKPWTTWPRDVPLKSLSVQSGGTGCDAPRAMPSKVWSLLKNAAQDSVAVELLHGVKHFTIQGTTFMPQDDIVAACFDFQKSSGVGELLCSLCPHLEQMTLDNVAVRVVLLSSLVSLKQLRILNVIQGALIRGVHQALSVSMFSDLRSLEEVYWARPGWPGSLMEYITHAPNLKHVYIEEAPLSLFPAALLASHHPTAVVHVKAFSLSMTDGSSSWDVAGLANSLREYTGSFDWPGTLILTTAPVTDDEVQALHKISDIFSDTGPGITKIIMRSHPRGFLFSSDDVWVLAQATPHVSKLELQDLSGSFKPHMLKCMLEVWPVRMLSLRTSHLSFVRHLRTMRTKERLVLRASLYVKVFSDEASLPQHSELEFVL